MEYGHAVRPIDSEVESGDRVFALACGERTLFGVIDGLGHGPLAALAAAAAADFLQANATLQLELLMRGCDRAIARTRGAAITLLRICAPRGELEHVAIGNVEVAADTREPVRPFTRAGVVGAGFRKVALARYKLHPGDLLAVHSDGVSGRFSLSELRGGAPGAIARHIVDRYGRPHDDASCLVIAL